MHKACSRCVKSLSRGDWVRIIIALILITVIALSFIFVKGLKEYLNELLIKVEAFGIWGNVIVVLIFVLGAIVAIAGTFAVLCIGTGFAYGAINGTITSFVGGIVSCMIAFLVGKTLLRKSIQRKLDRDSKRDIGWRGTLYALDAMLSKRALVTVIMARLAIFPPYLTNYFFAATSVPFPAYCLGTVIGLSPGIVMFSLIGASIRKCDSCKENSLILRISIYCGVGVTVILSIIFSVWARSAIKQHRKNTATTNYTDDSTPESVLPSSSSLFNNVSINQDDSSNNSNDETQRLLNTPNQ